jgi:hypothetical protein
MSEMLRPLARNNNACEWAIPTTPLLRELLLIQICARWTIAEENPCHTPNIPRYRVIIRLELDWTGVEMMAAFLLFTLTCNYMQFRFGISGAKIAKKCGMNATAAVIRTTTYLLLPSHLLIAKRCENTCNREFLNKQHKTLNFRGNNEANNYFILK